MISFEGIIKWLRGVREPIGYDWDARRIPTLPKAMLRKSLEWKRATLLGTVDVDHTLELGRSGWVPVYSIFGKRIRRDGLCLMWRDTSLTAAVRLHDGSQLRRQLASARRGALSMEELRDPLGDQDGAFQELATRGRSVDWGFDPYEGIDMKGAFDALDKLHQDERAKRRVVPFPPSETPSAGENK